MPLFTGTTADFQKYVPVTLNFSMDGLLPELDATESSLLPQFLGDAVADQIVALVGVGLDPIEEKPLIRALYLAKVAVARIGFARYLPFAEIQIGDDGITVSAADGRKAAFEYQTNKLERRLLDEGWRAIDELVTLVAKNAVRFPEWVDSPYYQEHQDALFKTPAEFSRYYPIQDRWLTYWALRPFIQAVEEDRGAFGLFRIALLPEDVSESIRDGLGRKLRRALAYQAVIDALPHLSVELNGANVQVNYASQFGNATYYQPPGKDHLGWVLANLQNQADLAWGAFENAITTLLPVVPVDTEGAGLGLIGRSAGAVGHPVVMLL